MANKIKAEELVPLGTMAGQDLTGRIFDRLTIIRPAGRIMRGKSRYVVWLGECSCGNTVLSRTSDLTSGDCGSCGCRQRDAVKRTMTTHGHANKHPLYRVWKAMRRRCFDKNMIQYKDYGGRGIIVLEPWNSSFSAFITDMENTWVPGLTIDRIDNDGPYCKENCRWATRKEQANNNSRNRWIEFNGTRKTLQQWAETVGGNNGLISERLKRGWTVEQALTLRVRTYIKR